MEGTTLKLVSFNEIPTWAFSFKTHQQIGTLAKKNTRYLTILEAEIVVFWNFKNCFGLVQKLLGHRLCKAILLIYYPYI